MTKYTIKISKQFKEDLEKIVKQGKDVSKIEHVIEVLANKETLEEKYKDHALINDKFYHGCKECHIESDWLLIYKYIDEILLLYLVETGSYSDLFDM